jgi:hypothetical protein
MPDQDIVVRPLLLKQPTVVIRKIEWEAMASWVRNTLLPAVKDKLPEKSEDGFGLVSELVVALSTAVNEVKSADTWSTKLGILGGLVEEIASVVENIKNADGSHLGGANKKELVIAIVTEAYNVIDRGFDGKSNNIKLPWVPGPLSDAIEHWVLVFALNMAIDAIIMSWHRNPDQE